MITGLGSVRDLASGKRGAFYNTLEEFSKYWTRIDIVCPRVKNIDSGNSKFEILNPKQTLNSKYQTKILFGNVYVHVSTWPLIFHPIWFLKKGFEIYKEQKFDLMTVHDFPPFYNGLGASLLEKFIKVPYILEIFHIPGYPRAASTKESIYKFLFKSFIRFDASGAKAVRVMNQNQVPEFLIKTGVPKEKIIYIPAIYIDTDVFKPTGLQKQYDLIFIGRLERNKGIDLFLETVRKTRSRALIVGVGSLYDEIKFKIQNSKFDITLYGWARDSQEIAELLNKSKILVMPSYNEGGPRVVVEALACGVPVLATPVGIVPDLLKNGLGGDIVAWSADDIAQRIQGLLNDSARYHKYSQNGPEIAKQFEKKEAIGNYADKLKELIN